MTNRKKIKDDTLTGHNIVEDNIATMVNNGDIDYEVSPCVVMHNLVDDHNNYVDKMGQVSMSNHVNGTNNPHELVISQSHSAHDYKISTNPQNASISSRNKNHLFNPHKSNPEKGHDFNLPLNSTSNGPLIDEEKTYDEPVDYETAFGEYYPSSDKNNSTHQSKENS